ncbi:MAG: YigZ family protein [Hungatella sp.]
MTAQYKILLEGGEGELTEKKSRFLAVSRPIHSEEEASAFIEEIRKKYRDASHHCFAYVLGDACRVQRCSDDGEPSQTAGLPILDVLLGRELHDLCVVVTRYFGGTLLGTGGLIRAYSGAAAAALDHSRILEKCHGTKVEIHTDYNSIGKLQYRLEQQKVRTLETSYTDQVVMTVLVPDDQMQQLRDDIIEETAGRAQFIELEDVFYGISEQELLLF